MVPAFFSTFLAGARVEDWLQAGTLKNARDTVAQAAATKRIFLLWVLMTLSITVSLTHGDAWRVMRQVRSLSWKRCIQCGYGTSGCDT
jgi:hypothetical protein